MTIKLDIMKVKHFNDQIEMIIISRQCKEL